MLAYFYKDQSQWELTEALYWRCYLSVFLINFIVLLQFTGALEALFFAWMLVDVIGLFLFIPLALSFITNALRDKLRH